MPEDGQKVASVILRLEQRAVLELLGSDETKTFRFCVVVLLK